MTDEVNTTDDEYKKEENDNKNKWEKHGVINKNIAKKMISQYNTEDKVINGLNELKKYWGVLLSNFQVKTEDEKVNRMVNIWNQYQCIVTYNLARSASFFETGIGRGIANNTSYRIFIPGVTLFL